MLRPALVALCAATIATGAMAQSTGVAVCDDFLKKYEICVNTKLPADARDTHKGAIDQLRKTIVNFVKSPDGKSPAEHTCTAALLKLAGCTF
jgi:hypothetical protein